MSEVLVQSQVNLYNGNILKLGYNVIAVQVSEEKVVYFHQFPPAQKTTNAPNLDNKSSPKELIPDIVTKETFIKFISNKNLHQANLNWKGGEWGTNNFCTTHKTWCPDAFIGDNVSISKIKSGIIPYNIRFGKPFEENDQIIEGSEEWAWSCNITIPPNEEFPEGTISSGYVCDKPMGQNAIDILFIWENEEGVRFSKILKRGKSHPNNDMPELFMPGAGEHKEPGDGVRIKEGALRAVKEEIGIPDETLSECFLLKVGNFFASGRDPRYWFFSEIQDDNIIEFGMERESSTEVYLLYIKSNTDNQPKETLPLDSIEVGKKFWVGLKDKLLNKLIWMIPEHGEYLKLVDDVIDKFLLLSVEEQLTFKVNL